MNRRLPVELREARQDDAPALAAIYAEGIEDRIATFETEPPSPEDLLARFAPGAPLLVAEARGEVAGWAGVVPYSERSYYAGVGECMIYVERGARGGGLGRRLLERLLEEAESRGFHKLTAKLFATNLASVAVFERSGFRRVGVHLRHGRLEGEWRDVLVLERLLGRAAAP